MWIYRESNLAEFSHWFCLKERYGPKGGKIEIKVGFEDTLNKKCGFVFHTW